ncbi:MAG: hypothetical protein ACP6IS_07875 [Candidatus Asgardarchaeia archaeon]
MSITIVLTILSIAIFVIFSILIHKISSNVENISIEDFNTISSKKSEIINMAIKANIIFILLCFVYLGFPIVTLDLLQGKAILLYWYLFGLFVLGFNLIWGTWIFKFNKEQKNVLTFSNQFEDYTIISDTAVAILAAFIIAGIAGAITLGVTIFILPGITDNPYLLAAFVVLLLSALFTHLVLIVENKRLLSHLVAFLFYLIPLLLISISPTKDLEQFYFYMYALATAFAFIIFLNTEDLGVVYNKDELIDYAFMWVDSDVTYLTYSEFSLKELLSIIGNTFIFVLPLSFSSPLFIFVATSLFSEPSTLGMHPSGEIIVVLIKIILFFASIVLYGHLFNSINLLNLKILNTNVTNELINAVQGDEIKDVTLRFNYDLSLGDELEAALLLNLDSWIRFLLDDVKYDKDKNEFTLVLNKKILEYWISEVERFSEKLPTFDVKTLMEKADFSKNQAFFLLSVFRKGKLGDG